MRCKVRVTEIADVEGWMMRDSKRVRLKRMKAVPVVDGSLENESFFAATPSGSIELGVINADALVGVDVSDELYVDFTVAKKAAR